MAKSVLYMSMSLDGFITGPDDGPDNGLGTGGLRLHEWLGEPVSDYPHFDSEYPGTVHELKERSDITDKQKQKILSENAKDFLRM